MLAAMICFTACDDTVSKQYKAMEEEMMRRRSTAGEGRRIIDIDLLSYGETVLRPDDWNRQYIQDGISALSANTGRKR